MCFGDSEATKVHMQEMPHLRVHLPHLSAGSKRASHRGERTLYMQRGAVGGFVPGVSRTYSMCEGVMFDIRSFGSIS